MCTMIALKTVVNGGGKGAQGWFPVREAIVAYDHTTYLRDEHALLLDFVNVSKDRLDQRAVGTLQHDQRNVLTPLGPA